MQSTNYWSINSSNNFIILQIFEGHLKDLLFPTVRESRNYPKVTTTKIMMNINLWIQKKDYQWNLRYLLMGHNKKVDLYLKMFIKEKKRKEKISPLHNINIYFLCKINHFNDMWVTRNHIGGKKHIIYLRWLHLWI